MRLSRLLSSDILVLQWFQPPLIQAKLLLALGQMRPQCVQVTFVSSELSARERSVEGQEVRPDPILVVMEEVKGLVTPLYLASRVVLILDPTRPFQRMQGFLLLRDLQLSRRMRAEVHQAGLLVELGCCRQQTAVRVLQVLAATDPLDQSQGSKYLL